eukprot:3008611-Rhodomonas_salina.1
MMMMMMMMRRRRRRRRRRSVVSAGFRCACNTHGSAHWKESALHCGATHVALPLFRTLRFHTLPPPARRLVTHTSKVQPQYTTSNHTNAKYNHTPQHPTTQIRNTTTIYNIQPRKSETNTTSNHTQLRHSGRRATCIRQNASCQVGPGGLRRRVG